MGVALMPAIFDAPNVKKVPVRDFDAKRVISQLGIIRLGKRGSIVATRRRHEFYAEIHGIDGPRPEASAGVRSLAHPPSRRISSPVWTVNSTTTVLLGTLSTSAQISTMRRPRSRR